MDFKKVSKEILNALGGKDNIVNAAHCSTRLRINLADDAKVNQAELDKMDAVKGTFSANGQYQIIIGAGLVNNVYAEFNQLLGQSSPTQPTPSTPKDNLLQRFVKMLSEIFVPIIPAIVAGGLLMGLGNLFTAKDLFIHGKSIIEAYPQYADLYNMIDTFANAPFVFLPVLIGFSATKRFGGNPYLGAALAMLMVHPSLMNFYVYGKLDPMTHSLIEPATNIINSQGQAVEGLHSLTSLNYWHIFGLNIEKVAYQGTVLPILAASYLLAVIEKNLRKVTPSWLDNLTTPLLALFITGFITFVGMGPVLREAGTALGTGLEWLYTHGGFIGAGIFGFFYAPIVITGMHQSFIAIETQLIATNGWTFIFPIAAMSNMAQGGATFATLFTSKDAKTKGLATAAGLSAVLGITEPAMFGINLKLKYPFYAAIIGAAVGAAYIGLTKVHAITLGAAALPGFISIQSGQWLNYGIGMALAAGIAFILTFVFSKNSKLNNEN